MENIDEINKLKKENEHLKRENEIITGMHNSSRNRFDKLYNTLQEIKAIAKNREIFCENCSFCCDEFTCDDCGYVKILQKITKAEEE